VLCDTCFNLCLNSNLHANANNELYILPLIVIYSSVYGYCGEYISIFSYARLKHINLSAILCSQSHFVYRRRSLTVEL
jgi:hypothetical protein